MATILLVEHDPTAATRLAAGLTAHGHTVLLAASAAEALRVLQTDAPSAVILDHNVPDVDGLVLMTRLRALTRAPIVVSTDRPRELERTLALNLGAVEVFAKPVDVDALLNSLGRALSGATSGRMPQRLTVAGVTIDQTTLRITVNEQPVGLTPTEYRLLLLLVTHENVSLTTGDISGALWGYDDPSSDHMVHVYVGRLRRKLSAVASGPDIVSVRGRGYHLAASARPPAQPARGDARASRTF